MQHTIWKSREALEAYQLQTLRDVVRHAWKHSAFYRELYSGHGIREKDIGELTAADLPFTDKKILMENFDSVVTDSRIRKKDIENWLSEDHAPTESFLDEFTVFHTSGSVGDVGLFVFDQTGLQVMNSTLAIHFPAPISGEKTRVAVYRVTIGHHAGVSSAVRMSKALYDVSILSVLEESEKTIAQLNSFQPHRLDGYASSIILLAEWALEGKLRIHPKQILTSGDTLTIGMEHLIQEAWGAPVHIFYGCSESPCLAIRKPGEEEMTVMDDLNLLEVLGDDNLPVTADDLGRVVISNLYNYAFPLLRYELGDHVIRAEPKGDSPCSRIRNLIGRESEFLPIKLQDGSEDKFLPSIFFDDYRVPGLVKIQFISNGSDHVQVHYMSDRDIETELQAAFHRLLNMKGVMRTTFEFQRVSKIPTNPRTSKHQFVRIEGTPTNGSPAPRLARSPSQVPCFPSQVSQRQEGPTNPFEPFPIEEVEGSIPERFEKISRRYPDRLAVKDEHKQLTYRELNEAADRVAQAILNQRGPCEEPIGLLFEQGVEVIVAILGVWKAGKFYVILDPTVAQERNTFILDDAQAALVLTDTRHLPLTKYFDQLEALNIDDLEFGGSPSLNIPIVTGESRACLFYTSGSIGKPKGVLQNHRNLLLVTMNYTNGFHVSHDDHLALFYSPGVISTARVFLLALCNGCQLSSFNLKKDGFTNLAKWVRQEEISLFISVSSVFRNFAETLREKDGFPKIRLIRLGGEPVLRRDVEAYKKYFSDECLLVNRLGSTETGDFCWNFMDKCVQVDGPTAPVGYPIEGHEILLLDEAGDEVGPGEMGEIAVRSAYLALEYWRRPDLTKAAFLPNPEGGDKRIYRTGDLGRILSDGQLVHLGRKDHMVKVRGYRVELPEVEAALSELDSVSEAVVMPRKEKEGHPYLVAYVVPSSEAPLTISALRRSLADKLPDYMIPSSFVVMKNFPVAQNGKINRGALPEPGSERPHLETALVQPGSSIEMELSKIWTEVLGLDEVGVHDQFMELGGHSLQAGRIIARAAEAFGVVVPLRAFFETPTIANLALLITEQQAMRVEASEMAQILDEVEGRL